MGQQSWLRLLGIDHHQVLAGTSASMAPGFEDAEALAEAKASSEYWAKSARQARKGRLARRSLAAAYAVTFEAKSV